MGRLTVVVLTVFALALPGQALAATASKDGTGTVTVTGQGTEANRLTVSVDGSNLRIVETGFGVTLTAGAGCVVGAPNQVLCPAAGTADISMTGATGDDELTNSTGITGVLDGGADDDELVGGTGVDVFTGGTGSDWVHYSGRTAPISASPDGAANDGQAGELDVINTDVESLTGGSGADTLTGSAANNYLDGGPGADNLTGGGGFDTIVYHTRSNPVRVTLDGVADDGEAGENDNPAGDVEGVIGGNGADTLIGNAQNNVLWGSEGDDTMDGRGGSDETVGFGGTDTTRFTDRSVPLTITLDGNSNDGAAGENDNVYTDNVTGGSGDDTITGEGSPNALAGGAGADTLNGMGGNDKLDGGDGVDALIGAAGADTFAARDGVGDRVSCGSERDHVTADASDATEPDCETVDRGAAASPATAKVPAPALRMRISKAPITLDRKGRAPVAIACPTAQGRPCVGKVKIDVLTSSLKRQVTTSRRSRRRTVVGSQNFKVSAGKRKKINVRISRRGRRQVMQKRRIRCRVSVSNKGLDGKVVTVRRTVTLKAPTRRAAG